jgi:hypothetical protein
MVDQDAPAGKAGIKEHDVILSNERHLDREPRAQLKRMIRETPPGRVVTFGHQPRRAADDDQGATCRSSSKDSSAMVTGPEDPEGFPRGDSIHFHQCPRLRYRSINM